MKKINPTKIENEYPGGLPSFFKDVSDRCSGLSVSGDCVSYAAGFCDILEYGSIYGTFLPNVELADAPMHVAIEIDGSLYDGIGRKSREEMLVRAAEIMWEDWSQRAREIENEGDRDRKATERAVYKHVKKNAGKVKYEWLSSYPNYSQSVHTEVKEKVQNILTSKI